MTVTVFLETKARLLMGKCRKRTYPPLGLVVVLGLVIWGLAHIQMCYPGSELREAAQMKSDKIVGKGFPTPAGVQQILLLSLLGSFENCNLLNFCNEWEPKWEFIPGYDWETTKYVSVKVYKVEFICLCSLWLFVRKWQENIRVHLFYDLHTWPCQGAWPTFLVEKKCRSWKNAQSHE